MFLNFSNIYFFLNIFRFDLKILFRELSPKLLLLLFELLLKVKIEGQILLRLLLSILLLFSWSLFAIVESNETLDFFSRVGDARRIESQPRNPVSPPWGVKLYGGERLIACALRSVTSLTGNPVTNWLFQLVCIPWDCDGDGTVERRYRSYGITIGSPLTTLLPRWSIPFVW